MLLAFLTVAAATTAPPVPWINCEKAQCHRNECGMGHLVKLEAEGHCCLFPPYDCVQCCEPPTPRPTPSPGKVVFRSERPARVVLCGVFAVACGMLGLFVGAKARMPASLVRALNVPEAQVIADGPRSQYDAVATAPPKAPSSVVEVEMSDAATDMP